MRNRWIRYTTIKPGPTPKKTKASKKTAEGVVIVQPLSYIVSKYGPMTEAKMQGSKNKRNKNRFLMMAPTKKMPDHRASFFLGMHVTVNTYFPMSANALPQGLQKEVCEGQLVIDNDAKKSKIFFDSFVNELSNWARFLLSLFAGVGKRAQIRSIERGEEQGRSEREKKAWSVGTAILEAIGAGLMAIMYFPGILYSATKAGIIHARSDCFKLIEGVDDPWDYRKKK